MRFAVAAFVAVVAGCGPQPLGAPCPPAVETASPSIAPAASGGAFVFGDEGLPAGTFVRHFNAAGGLAWTVALPDLPAYEFRKYAVAGDTVFVSVEKEIGDAMSGVRDGAIAFAADVPYDCRVQAFESEGDRLRVYGENGDNHSCSFRVAADGTFDDPLVFDEGVYALRRATSGGFVAVATDGVIRYDAAANRLWTHAGSFTDALEAGGAVLAFGHAAQTTLVRIGSDGQGEEVLAAFAPQAGSGTGESQVVPLATTDGAVIVVGYAGAIEVVRVVSAGVAWSHTVTGATLGAATLGQSTFVVRGRWLVDLDLDGNTRFTAPSPLDATVGADDVVRTADVKELDPCRRVLRASTLDSSGQVQASWSAR